MNALHTLSEVFASQQQQSQIQRSQPLHLRIARLKKLERWIVDNRSEIEKATYADFKKTASETAQSEVYVVLAEIRHCLKHIDSWAKPQKVKTPLTFWGTKSQILKEPKGVCLIIAPWNYPFSLCLAPLVSCLAAGNTAMIKPSEMTPNTSALISGMMQSLFTPAEVSVFEGDKAVAEALLNLPFDHIFFTGSPAVGKVVMQAAAQHLSSVTLELGGKSPCIIDHTAKLKDAAEKVAWGKGFNNGQTCISPDYLLVHESVEAEFIKEMKAAFARLYQFSGEALLKSADYARIVNARHFERLKSLLDDALAQGASVALGGYTKAEENFIEPTVLNVGNVNCRIMEEEVFGPVIPYKTYSHLDEILNYINARPKPLSLYVFSNDDYFTQRIIRETSSGGIIVNGVLIQFAQNELPFGGVNNSGIGKSHGVFGFESFSNLKPVMYQRTGFSSIKTLFPPYTKKVKWIENFMIKYL